MRVTFDPAVLSFRDLLTVFFTIHDPTTRNRQGNDVGTQYRSVVFCTTPEQRATAEAVVAELGAAKLWRDPIVTEIAGPAPFYEAEDYHQEYFAPQWRAAVLPGGGRPEGRQVPQALRRTPEAQGTGRLTPQSSRQPRAPWRVRKPPAARQTPTDQNTGARPSEEPTAPNRSGTATDDVWTSDIRTPTASPMRPAGVCT